MYTLMENWPTVGRPGENTTTGLIAPVNNYPGNTANSSAGPRGGTSIPNKPGPPAPHNAGKKPGVVKPINLTSKPTNGGAQKQKYGKHQHDAHVRSMREAANHRNKAGGSNKKGMKQGAKRENPNLKNGTPASAQASNNEEIDEQLMAAEEGRLASYRYEPEDPEEKEDYPSDPPAEPPKSGNKPDRPATGESASFSIEKLGVEIDHYELHYETKTAIGPRKCTKFVRIFIAIVSYLGIALGLEVSTPVSLSGVVAPEHMAFKEAILLSFGVMLLLYILLELCRGGGKFQFKPINLFSRIYRANLSHQQEETRADYEFVDHEFTHTQTITYDVPLYRALMHERPGQDARDHTIKYLLAVCKQLIEPDEFISHVPYPGHQHNLVHDTCRVVYQQLLADAMRDKHLGRMDKVRLPKA